MTRREPDNTREKTVDVVLIKIESWIDNDEYAEWYQEDEDGKPEPCPLGAEAWNVYARATILLDKSAPVVADASVGGFWYVITGPNSLNAAREDIKEPLEDVENETAYEALKILRTVANGYLVEEAKKRQRTAQELLGQLQPSLPGVA